MSFPIYLTEEALKEEVEAYLFYEDEKDGLGERFLGEVEEALKKVSEHRHIIPFQMRQKPFAILA